MINVTDKVVITLKTIIPTVPIKFHEAAYEDVEGQVPASKKRICRPETLKKILQLLDVRETVCITGVRRCGKSTAMYQAIDHLIEKGVKPENILYFNLDEPFEEKNIGLLD